MATLTYKSRNFVDWVLTRLRAAIPAAWAEQVPVYDERELDLEQLVGQAVNSGLGACVVASLPSFRKEGPGDPGNTLYRVSVEVAVMHNATLAPELPSAELTEDLFRAFVGAEWETAGGILSYRVGADTLTLSATKGKLLHEFTVYCVLDMG